MQTNWDAASPLGAEEMKKNTVSVMLFVCSAASLAIAIYQLMDSRFAEGILSVVFSSVFLVGGIANRNGSGRVF